MPSESGWDNQKKFGPVQFKTIHPVGNDSFGAKSILLTNYQKTPAAAITVAEVKNPSSGLLLYYRITMVAHGASVGDIMKMVTGTIVGWEFQVLKVINANTFDVLPTAIPVSAETAEIFNGTGFLLVLAFGAVAAEVGQMYIMPGGNGPIDLEIPAGTRLSVKAIDTALVNVGYIAINLLG